MNYRELLTELEAKELSRILAQSDEQRPAFVGDYVLHAEAPQQNNNWQEVQKRNPIVGPHTFDD